MLDYRLVIAFVPATCWLLKEAAIREMVSICRIYLASLKPQRHSWTTFLSQPLMVEVVRVDWSHLPHVIIEVLTKLAAALQMSQFSAPKKTKGNVMCTSFARLLLSAPGLDLD